MAQESVADILSGKDDQEIAGAMQQVFSNLAQNPDQYPSIRKYLIDSDLLDEEDLPEQMTPQQMMAVSQSLAQASGAPEQGVGDMLAAKGRNGDSMLAHVNPQEAELLKSLGGSGTINPETGMPEFGILSSIKNAFKRVVKPLIGAAIGYTVGGPVGAAIGAGMGETSYQMEEATNAGKKAAAEQAQIQRQAEEQRRREAEAEAERIRQAEERRQQNIAQGATDIASVFGQFNDDFYNKRSGDYLNYALPQLDREYETEQRQLIAQLARSGNLNSSLRGDLSGKLLNDYNTRKTSLQDTANKYAADARAQVESARGELLQSNSQLADPGTIRTMAQARATGVAIDPQYQSLGDMIANLSSTIPGNAPGQTSSNAGGVQLYSPSSRGSGRLVA